MKLLPVWIFGLLILCTSCADDNELAWVSVRNDTDYNLEIEFLPTENANGYKLQASLDPFSESQVQMYSDVDEGIDPNVLLSRGYDSLIVRVQDLKATTIHFGKRSTPNYAYNPFNESELWDYEEFSADFPTNTSPNTQFIHNHLLVIDLEKVVRPDLDPAEYAGLTWSYVRESEEGKLVLDGVLASYDDILAYDTASHTYLLDSGVSDWISGYLHPTYGTQFAVSLDAEIVFLAWFVPSYSSQAFPERVIVNPNTNSNKFRFNLGYPVPDYEREDPCNDPRIVARLEADNKLISLAK